MKQAIFCYGMATILIVTSFFLPPLGIIDNSVLMAAGLLFAGYQLMFGHSIKEITIDKTGVHIVTHNKEDDKQ